MIAVVVGLIYWQRQSITYWISHTAIGITQLFGWGMVLVVLAILTFLVIIFYKPILLLRYWNRWIGLLLLLWAIWGILAFIPGSGYLEPVNLGGRIGQNIIGQSAPTGVLIVLALIIVGVFFVAPRGFAHVIANLFSLIFGRLKKEPAAPASMPLPGPAGFS